MTTAHSLANMVANSQFVSVNKWWKIATLLIVVAYLLYLISTLFGGVFRLIPNYLMILYSLLPFAQVIRNCVRGVNPRALGWPSLTQHWINMLFMTYLSGCEANSLHHPQKNKLFLTAVIALGAVQTIILVLQYYNCHWKSIKRVFAQSKLN